MEYMGAEIEAKDIVKQEVEREAEFGYEPSSEDFVIAGQLAGIRKVVEFIHNEFGGYGGGELINILIDNNYGEDGSLDKWQAKLKEWGIR